MKINKNLPNHLTMLRLLLVPVYMACMLIEFKNNIMVAGAIFVVASITDFLDGNIARKYNLVSDFGKFADPVADKILVLTAVILFCETGRVTGWSTVIMVAREIMVASLRYMAVLKNRVLAADIYGKIKTMLQMVALIMMHFEKVLSFFPAVATVIYYLAVLFTVISGANYLIKNKDVINYGADN